MISKKYYDFINGCIRRGEPNIILQGSSRSGKTWNICEYENILTVTGTKLEIVNVGRTRDFLRNGCFKDSKKIFHGKKTVSPLRIKQNNSEILFKAYADEEEAKGGGYDISYFNECNAIKKEVIDQVSMRTRVASIYDFNPSNEFWISEIITKTNFLKTTWKDNPYLTQKQIDFFENVKLKAERSNATVYDKWYYKVFYLGEYGNLQGNVFSSVTQISEKEHGAQTQTFSKIYGLDFGFSNDPCALVEVAKHGNKLFLKQLYYSNQTNDFQLAEVIKQKCSKRFPVVYDTGGGGDVRANHLQLLTKHLFQKKRNAEIEHGVAMIQGLDLYICGEETFKEFKGYEYKDGKFTEANNHSIDAVRYAYEYGVRSGRIKP